MDRQSHQVIALAATGQLALAATGQIQGWPSSPEQGQPGHRGTTRPATGCRSVRLRMPFSRGKLMVIAMLLKQAVIAAKHAMDVKNAAAGLRQNATGTRPQASVSPSGERYRPASGT
jgi:hypothetical protein